MSQRLSPYLILSVLVHGFGLSLWWWLAPSATKRVTVPPSLVYLEPVEPPASTRPRSSGLASPRGTQSPEGKRAPSLSELSLRPYGASDIAQGGPGFEGTNSPLGMLESAPRTVFFERLHDQIDSALYYPEEFKENGIEGIVIADLEWRRGEDEKTKVQYRVSSASPFLRVFVIQRLRKIFNEETMAHTLRQNETIKLRCQFHFEIHRREGKVLASHGDGVMGNQLTFHRAAKHRGEWKLGPLQGFAVVPQVGVDIDWFVRQFEEDRPDPLAAYRNDPEWRVN